MNEGEIPTQLDNLLNFLKRNRGFDFTGYKRATLTRRIRKCMQSVAIHEYDDYIDYLENHVEEFTHLFNTILINVTDFFRDTEPWTYLSSQVIPELINNKAKSDKIRVWCAGVSSGEEAYSIAMLLAEQLGQIAFRERVKIYATDIDEEDLYKARLGIYTQKEVANVPEEMLRKYFESSGSRHSFRKDLRQVIIFGRHDLIQDAPISHIDILICRNTLMYFNPDVQKKILSRFHFALSEEGYLFLGKAEMLLSHAELFKPVELKWRVFMKTKYNNRRERLLVLTHTEVESDYSKQLGLSKLIEIALDADPIAQIIIDQDGYLALANQEARKLFNLTDDHIGSLFHDLVISYRPVELRSLIETAQKQRDPILIPNVVWELNPESTRYYNVRVISLPNKTKPLGVSITFQDVTLNKHLQKELELANQTLETTMEELQSTNEELETANEELQSTIEELETTNEELQSTNEELETMNAELQSTNEELETTNEELRVRSTQLDEVNSFLASILGSLNGGVIVTDLNLQIQVWNEESENLWGLTAEELNGEHFLNLDIGLPVLELKQPIRDCLSGEQDCIEVILEAHDRRGRKFNCRISCMPLINPDKEIAGVILIMENANK